MSSFGAQIGGRCRRHPLNIIPCELCAEEHHVTAIPTMGLRLLEREIFVKSLVGSEVSIPTTVRVLQQRFDVGGKPEWRDVPIVKEQV